MQRYHFSRITQRLPLMSALLAAAVAAHAVAPTVPANVIACRACHGAAGISLNPTIPNLAGQKPVYLEAQLKAFRSKDRKNDFMNVIAGQLNDGEIHELATFWSGLPAGSSVDANGAPPVNAAIHSRMAFPDNFPRAFTVYQTVVEEGVMTKRFANRLAIKAARAGEQLPDGSVIMQVNYTVEKDAAGKDIAGSVQSYAGMESRGAWGKDIPLLLRNQNWDYALFAADGKRRDELNQAQCLACHKPRESDSYLFTMKQLRAAPM
jgi:cytochrome c553